MICLFRNTHFQSMLFLSLLLHIMKLFFNNRKTNVAFSLYIPCKVLSLIFQFLNVSLSPGSTCASTGMAAILITVMPVTHYYTVLYITVSDWFIHCPGQAGLSLQEAELIDLNSKGNSKYIHIKEKKKR